jgi:hypothetical protein
VPVVRQEHGLVWCALAALLVARTVCFPVPWSRVGTGERVGATHVLCADKVSAAAVLSSFEVIVRPMYSNPPVHGARIVTKVLTDPALAAEW